MLSFIEVSYMQKYLSRKTWTQCSINNIASFLAFSFDTLYLRPNIDFFFFKMAVQIVKSVVVLSEIQFLMILAPDEQPCVGQSSWQSDGVCVKMRENCKALQREEKNERKKGNHCPLIISSQP